MGSLVGVSFKKFYKIRFVYIGQSPRAESKKPLPLQSQTESEQHVTSKVILILDGRGIEWRYEKILVSLYVVCVAIL